MICSCWYMCMRMWQQTLQLCVVLHGYCRGNELSKKEYFIASKRSSGNLLYCTRSAMPVCPDLVWVICCFLSYLKISWANDWGRPTVQSINCDEILIFFFFCRVLWLVECKREAEILSFENGMVMKVCMLLNAVKPYLCSVCQSMLYGASVAHDNILQQLCTVRFTFDQWIGLMYSSNQILKIAHYRHRTYMFRY